MKSKAQITVVELTLAMVLFASFAVYFDLLEQPSSIDSQAQLESLTNSILYNDDFRNLTYAEDLSNTTVFQNWTNLTDILSSELTSYELVIGNLTTEKVIVSCSGTFYETFSERFYAIENETNFGLLFFRLGVCY